MLRALVSTLRPISRFPFRCFSQEEDPFKNMPPPPSDDEGEAELTKEEFEEIFNGEAMEQDEVSGHKGHKDLPGGHIRIFLGDFLGGGQPFDTSEFRIPVPEMLLKAVKFNPVSHTYDIVDINSAQYFIDSRKVMVGLAGAFFPQNFRLLHDWARATKAFKKQLYFDEIVITSVNDAYVMKRFAEKLGFEDRFTFLADWQGEWTKFLKLEAEEDLTVLGSRAVSYTGVVIESEVKLLSASQDNSFDYQYELSPECLWKVCKDKKTAARVFL